MREFFVETMLNEIESRVRRLRAYMDDPPTLSDVKHGAVFENGVGDDYTVITLGPSNQYYGLIGQDGGLNWYSDQGRTQEDMYKHIIERGWSRSQKRWELSK